MKEARPQTWIFLRGLSRETAHWGAFPSSFEKRIPGAKAITLDLPGNGEHHAIRTPTSLKALVEAVRADWKTKNPGGESPPYVFALSLGAMVALQWMQSYPEEIGAAVLVNTSLKGFSPFYQRISPGAYGTLVRLFLDGSARSREKRILDLTSQHRDWDADALMLREQIQKKHPVRKINAFRQILAGLSSIKNRQKPAQPVLLLNSLGDLLVHPDCSRAIAQAWDVPLRRHAWAGHDLPLDDPEWTLKAVAEWLETLPSSASQSARSK